MNKTFTKALLLFLLFIIFSSPLFAQLPVNTWAKNFGGTGDSKCSGMEVDKQNNIIMCGYFRGTVDFDPTAGVHNVSAVGDADIYVAKIDPNGNLLWVSTMGGDGLDQVNDLALDKSGNVAISGQFTSSNLDANPDAGQALLQSNGAEDAFLIYLDSNGHYKWSKSFGGGNTDRGGNVVFDTNDNLIFNGFFNDAINVEGTQLSAPGGSNGFTVKYQNNGNLSWAINLGNSGDDAFRGLAVDSKNNIIQSGYYNGTVNFDPLGPGHNMDSAGDESFICQHGPDGKLIWVNRILGTLYQSGSVICVDSKDNAYMAGSFNSGINFDPNNANGTIYPAGSLSMFISKYSSGGNFQYAKVIGGQTSGVFCYQMAPDASNNIYITGYFTGTIDFNPDPNTTANITNIGQRDFFLGKYDEDGNYKWAFNAGNPSCDGTYGIELDVDSQNNLLLGGAFCSTIDFDPSNCINRSLTAINNICDSFIAKYSQTSSSGASSLINTFAVAQQSSPAQINTTNAHITVNVPAGTNIKALAPSVTVTNGGVLSPASGTIHDFTKPVNYVVSTNCSSVTYTVNVVVASTTTTPNVPSSDPMVCATSGADGTTNISGSINTYFPPVSNVTLTAGSKTINLATVPATDTHGNSFGTVPIKSGDLLLIIQTQDATINSSNSTLYGSGNSSAGADNLGATGFTSLGNTGKFEYVLATSNVPLTGGTLSFAGSGAGGGTVYTYTNANATAARGKQCFQVIRVPQYANLKLTSNISPPPFNGKAGGIIAFQVSGNMDFNGFTVDVSERGFRGGYSLVKNAVTNISDLYVTNATDDRASGKGEGIAGTPRYMWDGFNQVDNIEEGLPGGSAGRGAPANAGGGGNDTNAGGAGGGNGGSGGVGGLGYEPFGGVQPSGGRPGSTSYTNATPDDATRLTMGGGGGGGHANDALTGVKGGVGGGIVIVSARTLSGNGTILANGANGAPGAFGPNPDGSGGGGAGGSVFLKISNASATANITVQAKGGRGGNTEGDNPANGVQPHGPGGGAGGGLVFYNIPSGTFHGDVSGGLQGKSNSGNGTNHGSGSGVDGKIIPLNVAALPPYLQPGATVCFPLLTTTMSVLDPATPKVVGGTATYIIKITNDPSAGSAAGVQADCLLPTGFTFQSATVIYTSKATGPAAITNTGTNVRPLMGDFVIPAGESVTVTLIAKIGCVASATYNSSAQAVYYDPTRDYTAPNRRITAKTNAFAGSNTTYQTTSYGVVGGANYNGSTATAENATVVNASVGNNTITSSSPNTFCVSGNPGVITGNTPSGGGTFQWQSSTNNITFTDITGATAKDYDPATLTVTTYYRRAVTSGSCTTPVMSNVVTITIQPNTSNNNIAAPTVTLFCAAGNPSTIIGNIPSGGNGVFTYTWESSADNNTFIDIAGANAKDYDPGVINVNTYYRRRAISALCSVPSESNVVAIAVQPVLGNNSINAPIGASFCGTGDAAVITGSTATGGNGGYAYQWQSSTNNATFTNIAGAVSKDYNPSTITATTYYRRTVTSGVCTLPAISNTVTIKVEPALANNSITAPAVNTFCVSADPAAIAGTTPTGGNSVYVYKWQSSADNTVFTDIPGATAKNYDPPLVTATTYFRRAVTSDFCSVPLLSNTVSVKIVAPVVITNNVITAPAITSFCVSGNPSAITGNTPSGGIGTFTYQWQSSVNNITFTNISGATAIDLDPATITINTYYRRVATSGTCVAAVNSNVISLKILPATANNAITAPVTTTFCVTGNPAILTGSLPTGGTGAYSYQWQSSVDNATFNDIAGAMAKDYDPSGITVTTYYRRLVTSGACTVPVVSNVVKITIQTALTNNNIIAPVVTSFCINGNPAVVTGNVPSGGSGTYSYQWQKSTDNNNFGNIAGAISKDYDPPVVSTDTYYRRLVTSGTCTVPVISNVVSVTILSTPATPVLVDAVPSVCPGSGTTLKINSPIAGVTYNWYASPAKTSVLFSGVSYPTGNLTSAKTYYVETSNGACSSGLATATVSIASPPTAPLLVSNPVAVCSGSAATLNIASPQNGFIYNWYSTATGGTSLHTGISFVISSVNAGATYYAEATNTGGCISTSRTPVNITINPLPQLTVQDMAVCPGSTALLTAAVPDFTGQIGWYADATTATALQLGTSKTFTTPALNAAKSYYVEAVSTSSCKTPTRVKVTVNMLQQLDAPVVTVDSTTNTTVTFKWDAVTGAQGYQVSIDGGKTFISPSTGGTGLSHKVKGLQLNQQVTILVQAMGASACQLSGSSTAVTGTAMSPLGNQIYVANAFTPNGDGNNDVVYVHSETIKSMTFYVYDQWGELLFTSIDIKKGWDGYYKGTREPAGVYVYFVKAIMNDGAALNKKGTITLLR
jgi:gliding motility-associated-like protein